MKVTRLDILTSSLSLLRLKVSTISLIIYNYLPFYLIIVPGLYFERPKFEIKMEWEPGFKLSLNIAMAGGLG